MVKPMGMGALIVVLFLCAALIGGAIVWSGGQRATAGTSDSTEGLSDEEKVELASVCHSINTDTVALTTNCYNKANGTSEQDERPCNLQLFRTTASGYTETADVSDTDTASGTSGPLCGGTYKAWLLGNAAEGGNGSIILSANLDGTPITPNPDGSIDITFTEAIHTLTIRSYLFGRTKANFFDVRNSALLDVDGNAADTEPQNYSSSFESRTNGTAISLGTGGSITLEGRIYMNESDRQFNQHGMYITFNMSTVRFEKPLKYVRGDNGATPLDIVNLKGDDPSSGEKPFAGLSPGCDDLFAAGATEEYVYYTPAAKFNKNDYLAIGFVLDAKDGQAVVDGDDPTMTLVSLGTVQDQQDTSRIYIDACNNAATSVNAYPRDTYGFDVTT